MAYPSSGPVGNEQRRHARQTVLQTARIRFAGGAPIPAEIRDYCPTGLYVAFAGRVTPDAALAAVQGTPVEVEFATGATAAFRLSGRVARVAPGGVGIFVAAMPADALRALGAAGGPRSTPIAASAATGLTPEQAQTLRLECTGLFRNFLDAVLAVVFSEGAESLRQAGQDAPGFLERSRYDHGARELGQCRSRIEGDFFAAIEDRIAHVAPAEAASGVRPPVDKLAIVEEAEFEDWLNLSAVIKQIEDDTVALLYAIEQRYGRLTGRPIDRKANPFGPEVICRTFQDALKGLDFSNAMRAVLYKILGQAVSLHAPALYQQLVEALAPVQPLPGPRSAAASAARSEPAPDDKPPRTDLSDLADILASLNKQQAQAAVAQTADSAEYSLDRILITLNQFQRGTTAGTAAPPAMRYGRRGSSTARPEVLEVVGRLQQRVREAQDSGTSPSTASQGGETADVPALLRTLDTVPLATSRGMPLADQVSACLAAEAEARRLAPGHRQILDTTSTLFSLAQADIVAGSDLAALVKRLERPLLKLALQDPDFPVSPAHPGRQVLNLIEQYAVAADDQGRIYDARLQRFLTLLVDRICTRADDDPGVFEAVRDTLEKVLLPILQIRRARVARLQEANEGRARIGAARTRVNAALETRLAGRDVPALLLRLLDAGWRQYLVLLEMREGDQGDAWGAGMGVLDRVFAWLDPTSDMARTDAGAEALLSEIERALETVNVDANLLAVFLEELGDALADRSLRNAASTTVRVPPGRLATQGEADELDPMHRRLADRLRVGNWWDFNLSDRWVPMQLVWMSQPPAACAFASRSASSKLAFTLGELYRKLQAGQARPGKDIDLPLIERSEHALFDETYQAVVRHALHDPVTGLLNRKGFTHHVDRVGAPERADKAHAVGIIEFDQFRMIYNSCGVDAAEALTCSLVSAVKAQLGPDAVLAVLRDDTLAILLPNCSRADGYPALVRVLDQVKDYPFQHGQQRYSIGFNIGITEYLPGEFGAAEAIRRADAACITAKSEGRNRMQIYEQTTPQLQSEEYLMDWAGRVDAMLNEGGLYLRCQRVQPLALQTTLLPYYEILLGVEDQDAPDQGPTPFIRAVERLHRAHEVDIWVMRKAFEWIAANRDRFAEIGGFAINLSATSLSSPEVMQYLQKVLPDEDFPSAKITFEITESVAIESYGAAQDFIREIRRYGCKFSLDDFGSGFTSYSHLRNLRTDTLKIDGSFVRDMLHNAGDLALVKSMNDIGHSLGMLTVAEYVETPMIQAALSELGVDYAQGYAVHEPCRLDELAVAQGSHQAG